MMLLRKLNSKGSEFMTKMDYSRLRGKIAERGITQKALAREVGISEGQLCQKLSGRYAFKQAEMVDICSALSIDMAQIPEFFFSPKS